MAAKNDITGDTIATKGVLSKQGQDNWDLIFGKKDGKSIDTETVAQTATETRTEATGEAVDRPEESNTPKARKRRLPQGDCY